MSKEVEIAQAIHDIHTAQEAAIKAQHALAGAIANASFVLAELGKAATGE